MAEEATDVRFQYFGHYQGFFTFKGGSFYLPIRDRATSRGEQELGRDAMLDLPTMQRILGGIKMRKLISIMALMGISVLSFGCAMGGNVITPMMEKKRHHFNASEGSDTANDLYFQIFSLIVYLRRRAKNLPQRRPWPYLVL